MPSKKKSPKITQHKGPVLAPVRKLRHWKQQYDPNAKFLWRKNITYGTTAFLAGQEVPEGLLPPVKVRRFWESQLIELADFSAPDVKTGKKSASKKTGAKTPKKEPVPKKETPKKIRRGKWQAAGKTFKSKKAAIEYLKSGGNDG